MNHPSATLSRIQREKDQRGRRYALIGSNTYVVGAFKRVLNEGATERIDEEVDAADARPSLLRLRDHLSTRPFEWERTIIWIGGAENLFTLMSFPDDFPVSQHVVICISGSDQVYIPPSFIPVLIDVKGSSLQDFLRWILQAKGMSADIEVVRFLASEYKGNLAGCEKLIDQLYLQIHPRTVLTMKDMEIDVNMGWDCETIIRSLAKGDDHEALSEIQIALQTFHPKGIITVISRRVSLLVQVAAATVTDGGAPDPNSEIKPWVWRKNQELLQEIPVAKLFKWSVALDRAYAVLSGPHISSRWTLTNMVLEMSRI